MSEEFEIRVDRDRPPRLCFADTEGQPILAYHAELDGDVPIGWVLHVEHYQPFPMGVREFDRVFDALDKAKAYLKFPLPHACRLPGRKVSLLSKWGGRGENSYFLDATLQSDGSLTFSGQNLGPSIGYDGECEYWYTVKAEDVPALVIALGGEPGEDIIELLERRWSGEAVSGLGPAIKSSGVKYEFSSYY